MTDRPDEHFPDQAFDDLLAGRASAAVLAEVRSRLQKALDDPDESVSHDEIWSRLEARMKRALDRAA